MSVESLTLKGDLGSRNLSFSTRNETVQVRTLWGVVVSQARRCTYLGNVCNVHGAAQPIWAS